MLRKAFLTGLITMFLLSGIMSCGGATEEKETATREKMAEQLSPPNQEEVKPPKITGTYILPPEAKGKIERLNHRVYIAVAGPTVEIGIKNIWNEPIELRSYKFKSYRSGYDSDAFYFKVVSKDKEGQILGENLDPGFETSPPATAKSWKLQPKEIINAYATLFRSDETHSYEIIVEYRRD